MPRSLVDIEQLEQLIAPLCKARGVELVDARLQPERDGAVLRVLIELPDAEKLPKGVGVTLDDCTNVSRDISRLLDEHEELVPGSYRLEVSSPGIERPLVKLRDYERFAGREAKISLRAPVAQRKNFSGKLVGTRGDHVVLTDRDGQEIDVPFAEIQKAHLVYHF